MDITEIAWIALGGEEGNETGADAAEAAATQQATTQEAGSAFRKGVELAAGTVDPDEVAPLQPQREPETGPTDDGATDDEEGKTEDEIAAAREAKKAAAPKEGEQPPPTDDDADAEAKAAQEKFEAELAAETDQLRKEGVQPKAIERFKAQSTRIRDLETRVSTFEAERPELERQAQEAVRFEESIASTGSNPEQFGRVMGYLYAVNRGTAEQKQQARQALADELAWIDSELGIASEHHDPLEAHADLKKKVQFGEIEREDALELAKLRRLSKQRETEETQQDEQKALKEAQEQALVDMRAVGAELAKRDGAEQFKARLKLLAPTIQVIHDKYAPHEWAGKTREAYEALKKAQPVIPVSKPRVTPSGVRPGPGGGEQVPTVTSGNAFGMGVAAARKAGR